MKNASEYQRIVDELFRSRNIRELTIISTGGQGALAAAEVLASAKIEEGKCASVGLVVRGDIRNSPVINFVKFADFPPLPNCRNCNPTEMILFSEKYLEMDHPPVREALTAFREGILVVNSSKKPEHMKLATDFSGTVATADASGICQRVVGRVPPPFGITLLGVYARAKMGALSPEMLEPAILRRFRGEVGKKNVEAMKQAFDEARVLPGVRFEGGGGPPAEDSLPEAAMTGVMGYTRDLQPRASEGSPYNWRDSLPVCIAERCQPEECAQECIIYCPEAVARVTAKGVFGSDYDFCRGCGLCARECPLDAIRMTRVPD